MAERLEPRTSIPEVPGSSPGPAVVYLGGVKLTVRHPGRPGDCQIINNNNNNIIIIIIIIIIKILFLLYLLRRIPGSWKNRRGKRRNNVRWKDIDRGYKDRITMATKQTVAMRKTVVLCLLAGLDRCRYEGLVHANKLKSGSLCFHLRCRDVAESNFNCWHLKTCGRITSVFTKLIIVNICFYFDVKSYLIQKLKSESLCFHLHCHNVKLAFNNLWESTVFTKLWSSWIVVIDISNTRACFIENSSLVVSAFICNITESRVSQQHLKTQSFFLFQIFIGLNIFIMHVINMKAYLYIKLTWGNLCFHLQCRRVKFHVVDHLHLQKENIHGKVSCLFTKLWLLWMFIIESNVKV